MDPGEAGGVADDGLVYYMVTPTDENDDTMCSSLVTRAEPKPESE